MVGVRGIHFQKGRLWHTQEGRIWIPEFRIRDFQSTAGTKDSAGKRKKRWGPERTCHHPPAPECSLEYQAILGLVCVSIVGRTWGVESDRTTFESPPPIVHTKYPHFQVLKMETDPLGGRKKT